MAMPSRESCARSLKECPTYHTTYSLASWEQLRKLGYIGSRTKLVELRLCACEECLAMRVGCAA